MDETELKNSIFGSEDKDWMKVWNNKTKFGVLHDRFGEVCESLSSVKISKVRIFNQISPDWEKWTVNNTIELVILPICNIVDEDGTKTEKILKGSNYRGIKKYYPIDIQTDEMVVDRPFVCYFPTRNLVLCKVNMFADTKIYEEVLRQLRHLDIKIRTKEEIGNLLLEQQWKQNIISMVDKTKREIKSHEADIKDYKRYTIDKYARIRELKLTIESMEQKSFSFQEKLQKQIDFIKKMPIVKEFKITDRVYVSFGEIFLTEKVIVDREVVEGVEKPIIKKVKVPIGNLTFVIKEGSVMVKNDDAIITNEDVFEHPHARNGEMCFGEMTEGDISKAIIDLELITAIKLLYSWAISYNSSDTHMDIQSFYNERGGEVVE